MVAGFITALQFAVVAIETKLGTAAAGNYVRKNDAVTITGAVESRAVFAAEGI